ncbi:MAG: type II toxin-antitoxin system Phd/YefM family antitoxin [Fibrobacteria bacterium]
MERIQFDKDVKPISEFRANAPSLIDQVHKTKRPLVITQHGKSAAILMDVQEYEALLEKLDVLTDIGDAEADIKKKRFYSSEKALEKIRKKIGR